MAHIEEGVLQAYLDDEVGARAEIDAHIRACLACAAELERLRSASVVFASAIRGADTPAPVLPALAAVKRSTSDPITLPQRRFARIPLARAAMLLFGFATVASATIPGSPVRAWIGDALRTVGVLQQEPPAPATEPEAPAAATIEQNDEESSLSIEAAEGQIRIILTSVSADANIRVRVVEGDRALVQATGAAAKARFRTGPGRIEMVGVGKGDVVIDMPSSVRDASVVADGRVLYEKQ